MNSEFFTPHLRPIFLRNTCEKSSLLLNMNTLTPCYLPIKLIPFTCIFFQGLGHKPAVAIMQKHYLVDICDKFLLHYDGTAYLSESLVSLILSSVNSY